MSELPSNPVSPEAPARLIAARTRRQAMDWSLVLASQGIEHVIEHDDVNGWGLRLAEMDYERAEHSIRLYRVENRHWRWRQPVFTPDFFFDWTSLAWVVLIVGFYAGNFWRADFKAAGLNLGTTLANGEWWRWFTAAWLHADLTHLASNAVFGFLFLGLAMGRYGPGVGMLGAYLAGAAGNVLTDVLHDASLRGLGASGVVMGALGLLSFPAFPVRRQTISNVFRLITGGVMAGMLLFVFVGVDPKADVAAHVGGFVAGLIFGGVLALMPKLIRRSGINIVAGLLFAGLVIVPWLLALTRLYAGTVP